MRANSSTPAVGVWGSVLVARLDHAAGHEWHMSCNGLPAVFHQRLQQDKPSWFNRHPRWSRELGLYDEDGELFAVANVPPSYKPVLAEGSGRGQFFRMMLIHKAAGNIVLKIDPAVVVATREYVDDEVRDLRLSLEEKADKATTLAGYGITDAVTVVQGLAAGIGADLSVTNGLVGDLNAVTEPGEYYYNATNANRPSAYGLLKVWREQSTTVYQLAHADTNDVYIRRLLSGVWAPWRKLAATDSPEFTGTPRVPTPAIGDNSLQAAQIFVRRARLLADRRRHPLRHAVQARSEERRVGKECRSRWSPYH